jgi:hypothetical protein
MEEASKLEKIVVDDLRFRLQLGITDSSLSSLKYKKITMDLLDFGSGAATGAGLASSAIVAKTFFAGSGLLSMLGLATAVTPIGWVVAAGLAGGGLSVYFNKVMRKDDKNVFVIPKNIHSELDLLAVKLIEQMLPLVVYACANSIEKEQQLGNKIRKYFVEDWGYSEQVVCQIYEIAWQNYKTINAEVTANNLIMFKKYNPDCNDVAMGQNLIHFIESCLIDGDELGQLRAEELKERMTQSVPTSKVKRFVSGLASKIPFGKNS